MKMNQAKTVDEFINNYPADIREKLHKIRQIVHKVCPEASEKIAYGIPTFVFKGNLVHFSAYTTHIGFYPGPAPIAALKDELKAYETAKGTVRFPLNQPVPYELIEKMTRLSMEHNLERKR